MEYMESFKIVSQKMMADEDIAFQVVVMKEKVKHATDPFVWEVLPVDKFKDDLPENIESIWIFVIKENSPTIEHYHPNSIQHTIMVEGTGTVKIEGITQELKEQELVIIPQRIPHEFFPGPEKMVVFSFHTCESDDLIEVKTSDGKQRRYL